jgi:hypothetical protein
LTEPVLKGDLLNLRLRLTDFYSALAARIESQEISYEPTCRLCYEHRFEFLFNDRPFSSEGVDMVTGMLSFPYAAFGLLTDNALALSADQISISIEGEKGEQWIRVEDNGRIVWDP